MDRLKEILVTMRALLDEATELAGVDPQPNDLTTYPRVVTIDGASLQLDAPIAADWQPSMEARELTRYGSFGNEPSNGGQFGLPIRSPAGYPYHYTPDGFGGARSRAVLFAGVTFPDDAAVAEWKRAVAERDANSARVGGSFSPYAPR